MSYREQPWIRRLTASESGTRRLSAERLSDKSNVTKKATVTVAATAAKSSGVAKVKSVTKLPKTEEVAVGAAADKA